MPKKPALLTEEAASRFLGKLLFFRQRHKLQWGEIASMVSVDRRTLLRWRSSKRIPRVVAYKINGLLALGALESYLTPNLGNPKELRNAVRHCTPWCKEGLLRTYRLVLGYSVMWLASKLADTGVQLEIDVQLGNADLPMASLVARDSVGIPRTRVVFAVQDNDLLYKAFSFVMAEPKLQFEGVADVHGFEFCEEFITHFEPTLDSKVAVRIKQDLLKLAKKQHVTTGKQDKTRSGNSTAESRAGLG
ncbi:MAG: hypothetical protein E6R03_08875 [Hyphomicrobiaceae bacterium]|nr:MAG: hypothetical protein E6R03_08875 [Hyphomicrobiaceae bacterium]